MSDHRRSQMSAMRAVAHPVRLQILSLLTGAEMSATEVARELGLTHANASYHLRVLLDAGEVVVAGEEKIRGGVAKRYRHPWNEERVSPAPPSTDDQRRYVRAVAEELIRRHDRRRKGEKSYLVDAEMWVTPEIWEQVLTHVMQASALIHGEAKAPRAPGTVHVNLTALAFGVDDA